MVLTGGGLNPGDDDEVVRPGSADTTVELWNYETWCANEGYDPNENNWEEYCYYWLDAGFSWDQWIELYEAGQWALDDEFPKNHP